MKIKNEDKEEKWGYMCGGEKNNRKKKRKEKKKKRIDGKMKERRKNKIKK